MFLLKGELLLASGVLFAWAYLPKRARAEGRDPRFLVIVLRGALDGLGRDGRVRQRRADDGRRRKSQRADETDQQPQ